MLFKTSGDTAVNIAQLQDVHERCHPAENRA
jgi:hypothetical protein